MLSHGLVISTPVFSFYHIYIDFFLPFCNYNPEAKSKHLSLSMVLFFVALSCFSKELLFSSPVLE
jgi:hypothetical protein